MEQLKSYQRSLVYLLYRLHLCHWRETLCKEQGVFQINQLDEAQCKVIIEKLKSHERNRKTHHIDSRTT